MVLATMLHIIQPTEDHAWILTELYNEASYQLSIKEMFVFFTAKDNMNSECNKTTYKGIKGILSP